MTTTATPEVGVGVGDLDDDRVAPAPTAAWRSLLASAATSASTPVSGASLVAFRVAFGVCGAVAVARFVARGWVDELLLAPSYHFTYPGLSWVRPLPGAGMYVVCGVAIAAALTLAAGRFVRISAVVFTLCFGYVEAIDATTYLNHYELVTLLGVLMAVLPVPGRGGAGSTVPVGAVWLLRFQLGVVYVFAGLGKLDVDWLLHGEPLRTWLSGRTDVALIGPALGVGWVAVAMSWFGAVFDLSIVWWLTRRRTRTWGYAAVVAFHLATAVLFPSIGVFPFVMIVLTPIFFDPDWPLRLPRLPGVPSRERTRGRVRSRNETPVRAVLVVIATALWCLVQISVPLRHLAYPGDVRWTEEGYRWSWRVLLTEKEGLVTFRVTDPVSGRTRTVHPGDELLPFQERAMSVRPDLIRQYAHHLADTLVTAGGVRPEVSADAWVAIGGRERARLMDPTADLAAEPLGLLPADDIEPSPL